MKEREKGGGIQALFYVCRLFIWGSVLLSTKDAPEATATA